MKNSIYCRYIKRLLDFITSILAIVILSPLLLIVAVAIKLESKGPVLFIQKRIGKNKSYFQIYKFRTMKTDAPKDAPTHLLENPHDYITKVGSFLRKTSLDELPQLFNILRGEMSFVGPRPALWNQEDLIAERDKYGANDIRPGLTGLAQISGRDELGIEEKASLDGKYLAYMNLGFDINCIIRTATKVIRRDGIVEGDLTQSGYTQSRNVHYSMKYNTSTGNANCISTSLMNRIDIYSNITNEFPDTNAVIKPPLVSIVVATYRREAGLDLALSSLINQTYNNIEIVVVDDNADDTWNLKVNKIILKYQLQSHKQIRFIRNQTNKGSAETRNIGIRGSSGEYVSFLDDDDRYLPNKIKNQLEHMIECKSDFSVTDLNLYDESDKLIEQRTRNYIKLFDSESLLRYHLLHHITGTDTMMFRRDYLDTIGGFPLINLGDEFYLMLRAIEARGKFSYLAACDIKAYVHTEFAGLSSGDGKISGENDLYKFKKNYFGNLSARHRRYISMRHYAVLAFAEKRRSNYLRFVIYGIRSFSVSPISCLKLLVR
jgi:lipopolysaccharide/colanic/teichoic acid biosynthesis glycosyltransferase/glycosyltransferase involved in cell wall biosynthesis